MSGILPAGRESLHGIAERSGFIQSSFVASRCRDSPRRARYFLAARQESTPRNAPRFPGPAKPGCPPCARPGRATSQTRLRLKQRSRTSPPVPCSGRRGRGEFVDMPTLRRHRSSSESVPHGFPSVIIPARAGIQGFGSVLIGESISKLS